MIAAIDFLARLPSRDAASFSARRCIFLRATLHLLRTSRFSLITIRQKFVISFLMLINRYLSTEVLLLFNMPTVSIAQDLEMPFRFIHV